MTALALTPDVVHELLVVVVRCLRATVGVDAVIAAVDGPPPDSTISVALELAGDVRGPVTWVFPPEIALELVRRLMADPDPPPQFLPDGATELANILTGHASSVLEAAGFRCELGAPTIHVGGVPPGLNLRMDTVKGPIDVVLSLSRAPSSARQTGRVERA